MFNVLKPDLTIAFSTTSSALSILSSLYFYGTIIFLIPAGILLDNLSTRNIILMAMILSLIGLIIFVRADSIYAAGIGRFIIGICGGPFCFLSNMRLASRWFPANRLAFVTGIIVAIAMLGGIISQTPFIYLVKAIGWKNAMYVNLGLGLALTVLIYLFVYDFPEGKENEYQQQIKFYREHGFVKGLKTVILKLQNWYCGIFASLLNLPIFVFGALWGIMYLSQIFNLDGIQASLICSMLYFGMLIGSPVFGYISDKLHLRKTPMLFGALLCLVSVTIVLKSPDLSFSSLMFMFFLIGFGSSAQILAYPTITEINPLALNGSALSLGSTLIMAGGAIFQPMVGWLIELNWNESVIDGVPVYAKADYNFAFCIVPISIIISIGMAILIKETYCRRKEA